MHQLKMMLKKRQAPECLLDLPQLLLWAPQFLALVRGQLASLHVSEQETSISAVILKFVSSSLFFCEFSFLVNKFSENRFVWM
jgi:hypothetical protein